MLRPDRSGPPVARGPHSVPCHMTAVGRPNRHTRRCSGTPISARPSRPRPIRSTGAPNAELEAQDRRRHRHVRQAAAAGRLSVKLVPADPAGQALDQSARLPRALLRRPPDRRRGRLLPGHRQAQAARRDVPLCRPYRHACSAPSRARSSGYCGHEEIELALVKLARATGEQKYLELGEVLHRPARPAAALLRRGGARARRRPQGTSISRPTSTTSRTSRCASRTRSSAMPCAPCTSIPAWPTSPPNMATTA